MIVPKQSVSYRRKKEKEEEKVVYLFFFFFKKNDTFDTNDTKDVLLELSYL